MPLARYDIRQLNADTWALEEKTPINQGLCYLLCGREKALLIDTGFGFKALKPAVESLTGLPVVVANTHAHVDHIGGNHFFGEIWYHEADKPVFALHTNPNYTMGMLSEGLPKPLQVLLRPAVRRVLTVDKTGNYHYFKGGHVFHLGGRDVEVVHTPGHTTGSVCFLDREARMLFSGDTVCEWGILLHLEGAAPPEAFLDSMERLKGMEDAFDTVWPGHHGFPVEKSTIDDYRACAQHIVSGDAEMDVTQGRPCAKYGRVLITVPGALPKVPADG